MADTAEYEETTMSDLPNEILVKILHNLNYDEILNVNTLNRTFRAIYEDFGFWRRKAFLDFGEITPEILREFETDNTLHLSPSERYLQIATNAGGVYIGSERYARMVPLMIKALEQNDAKKINYFLDHMFTPRDFDVIHPQPQPGMGFRTPVFVRPELINFFLEANLGNTFWGRYEEENDEEEDDDEEEEIVYTESQVPLNRFLFLHPLSTSMMLTSLFAIYVKVNNLTIDRSYIRADALMKRHLGSLFERAKIKERDHAQLLINAGTTYQNGRPKAQLIDGVPTKLSLRGEVISFDENRFKYPAFQSIIAEGKLKREQLNERELAALTDEYSYNAIFARTNFESFFVSSTNAALRR